MYQITMLVTFGKSKMRKRIGKRHAGDLIVLVVFYYFLKDLIKMRNVLTMLQFLKIRNVD